ncbi:helix-turn-helix domain-containing protein [Pseudobutyrivibrio xylanivorans]|uniref:Transcriptional regulator, contains XRE-family HTH domain n=1 Tax=Pseudobutyrivibrio xylanivorans DSM 14809 TaxID=1123012 RepID=A0A1M6GLC9_PSEXY|nr:helix-turn-helix transcriptional regulator [Pseudobutyrivibrio xylanivorans]SHJ10750.1 Transcriptional regulator, contains XRE-family HTH domain [Pseudobutyrivibrio xylanivorans DSM 14809]
MTDNSELNTNIIVSNNLKYLLKAQGVSRKKVCNDLGIKYTTFCDWVNGRIIPKYQNLEKLGEYFGIETTEFFGPLDEEGKLSAANRILTYTSEIVRKGKVLDMNVVKEMSDEQVRELLNAGFTFKHKSYEERLAECGGLSQTYKFDWGEPKGREMF